ncbi:MAG: DNA translocase FtsK [Clostridia bacterium]|nr:DNA translocase FtsK [Clostridia bacterium]
MGRKKGSKNKTNTKVTAKKKYTKKKKKSSELASITCVLMAIIITIFFAVGEATGFSRLLVDLFKGAFGVMAYSLPVILMLIGIMGIVNKDKKLDAFAEVIKGIFTISLVSSVIYLFADKNYSMFDNFLKFVRDVFENSKSLTCVGGLFGGVIANLFSTFLGGLASKILLILLSLIFVLYMLNISLKQFVISIYNMFVGIGTGVYDVYDNVLTNESKIAPKNVKEEFSKRRRAREENISRSSNVASNIILDSVDKPNEPERQLRQVAKSGYVFEAMKEETSKDAASNTKISNVAGEEQVEFDLTKIGGNITEKEQEAKQLRDDFFKKQIEKKEDKNEKQVLTIDHTRLVTDDDYEFPDISILGKNQNVEKVDKRVIQATAVKLEKTLSSFGVEAKVTNITHGPTVTRYELSPSVGVRVSKIANLADDIALNLAAKSIRIEAPIPGKAAVGIELPNKSPESVFIREVIESDTFKNHESTLAIALGKDAAGDIMVGDIAKMPHVLIAGATGSGKSVCINSLIVSILYKAKPSEVKLILVDPKMVELSGYNGVPHLLIPVVTDPKKAAGALNWAVQEMVNRYTLFASKGVKDIKGYNKAIEKEDGGVKLPKIVIIIDELADLMMVAPNDVEDAICRLAQMARAAGMHLVIATQRPSVDVITGIIKANVPSRIAFTVSSQVDSRTILDSAGAEKLLGKGDMLYFPVGATKPLRLQGTWISESEIEQIVESIKKDPEELYSEEIIESIENTRLKSDKESKSPKDPDDIENVPDEDPLLNEAIDLAVDMGQASASMLQRRFKIGYSRAGRIVDQMEERGIISGYEGSKPRKVLVTKTEWQEIKFGMQQAERKAESEALKEEAEETLDENVSAAIETQELVEENVVLNESNDN